MGKKEIIKGLDLTINQGEVYGFIGPNGAGKTTTIRMVVGLMKLSGGDIKILGKSIQSEYKEAAKNIGAIVENPELYPFMTGWQNLMHYARMYEGITKERIKEVVSLVGLEKVINDKVGKYSLGMRQRLGVAQAILHKPALLILDEPTNGLDPAGIREIRDYIRDLAVKDNVAVMISSHLLSEIELMCDRIGIIQQGEIIQERSVRGDDEAEDAGLKVILDVEQSVQAEEILKESGLTVEKESDKLIVELNRKDIPNVVKQLIENEILVYGVTPVKATLEDQFLELTGGNVIG
ncbi:ABC transporter ATP-binding protein [Piscibacillus salipiscarius]|uniref:ABC transporter ATP-binding protein n=1 Tax=Piscibacillus salipiscarius TaxID=299480 RepID=UPI0006D0C6B1|nr:ABC transporter ATP-binding protein [Piscibacillus salipiscarius]